MKFLQLLQPDYLVELLLLVPISLILGFMVYNVFEIVERFSNNEKD